jgi:hypothetical protein
VRYAPALWTLPTGQGNGTEPAACNLVSQIVNVGFGHIEMATLMNRYTERDMAIVPMIRKMATARTTEGHQSIQFPLRLG